MRMDTLDLLGRVALATTTSGTSLKAIDIFNKTMALPVWGVPVTTFAAAAVGAGVSLFFGEPVTKARDLWGQVIASMFFGVAWSVLLADGLNWEWASKHQSMFALVTAAFVRWFLPAIIERGRELIKEYKLSLNFMRKKGGE